ncbi:MAG: FAD-binding oxidoreductase [Pseudomonadota bacterium]
MRTVDLAILGAGVFGLQLARQALLAGMSVAVFEARKIGSGASGGPLGALMPHIPDRWNAKKQFQFDALVALETECRELEDATGEGTGYGRVGRMMPLRAERFVTLAEQRATGAAEHWQGQFSFEPTQADAAWIDPDLAVHGAVLDTLAARLHPPSYIGALAAFVRSHPRGELHEQASVGPDATESKSADTSDGPVAVSQVAIAGGYRSVHLLEPLLGASTGTGVKGQARVVKAQALEGSPILYDDGCYIVPHANGTIAVGSSSQKQWTGEHTPDPEAWMFWDKALALCPTLRGAPIIAEWAGVRPRAMSADPMIGAVPGQKNVWVFTGGFKISLGIAHRAAAALVEEIAGGQQTVDLPESFRAHEHFEAAQSG